MSIKRITFKILMFVLLVSLKLVSFADSGYKGPWPQELSYERKIVNINTEYIEAYVGAGENFKKVNTVIPNGSFLSIYGTINKDGEKWSLVEVYDFDEKKVKNTISYLSNWAEYHKNALEKLNSLLEKKNIMDFAKFVYGDIEEDLSYVRIALKSSGWIKAEYLKYDK